MSEDDPLAELKAEIEADRLRLLERRSRKVTTNREWRANNKERDAKYTLDFRRKRKDAVIKLLGGKCADCHGVFPTCVYDVHHTDPTKKTGSLARMMDQSFDDILKEIETCILLCANCHRIRHVKNAK